MTDDLANFRMGPLPLPDPKMMEELILNGLKEGVLMHYKNGRIASNGDKVVCFPPYGAPFAGILYDATAGNDFCNGKIAITSPADPCPNLKECLHADDVKAAEIPDSTRK